MKNETLTLTKEQAKKFIKGLSFLNLTKNAGYRQFYLISQHDKDLVLYAGNRGVNNSYDGFLKHRFNNLKLGTMSLKLSVNGLQELVGKLKSFSSSRKSNHKLTISRYNKDCDTVRIDVISDSGQVYSNFLISVGKLKELDLCFGIDRDETNTATYERIQKVESIKDMILNQYEVDYKPKQKIKPKDIYNMSIDFREFYHILKSAYKILAKNRYNCEQQYKYTVYIKIGSYKTYFVVTDGYRLLEYETKLTTHKVEYTKNLKSLKFEFYFNYEEIETLIKFYETDKKKHSLCTVKLSAYKYSDGDNYYSVSLLKDVCNIVSFNLLNTNYKNPNVDLYPDYNKVKVPRKKTTQYKISDELIESFYEAKKSVPKNKPISLAIQDDCIILRAYQNGDKTTDQIIFRSEHRHEYNNTFKSKTEFKINPQFVCDFFDAVKLHSEDKSDVYMYIENGDTTKKIEFDCKDTKFKLYSLIMTYG